MMKATRLPLTLVMLLASAASASAQLVSYAKVAVGNPGNANDSTGYGGVPYEYQIGKYEVTIGQYTAFLNAVAKTDTYGLYNTRLAVDPTISGISTSEADGVQTYSPLPPVGDNPFSQSTAQRPVTFANWFSAARFANWMANGQPVGPPSAYTTEDGAYKLNGLTSGTAPGRNTVNPNTGAAPAYWIPTENEWYKAAYYSPLLNSGSGGYYLYATQSDIAPGNRIGGASNQANGLVFIGNRQYMYSTRTTPATLDGTGNVYSQNYLTDVGAFSSSQSHYGTFDQSGNVFEWNDLYGEAGVDKGIRGGCWDYSQANMRANSRSAMPATGDERWWWANGQYYGFRLSALPSGSAPFDFVSVLSESGSRTQAQAGYPALDGALSVLKTGTGTVVFDAANTYAGSTSIIQGTLLVTHTSALQYTSVTVQPGATVRITTGDAMAAAGLALIGSSQAILPAATRQVVSLGSLSVDQAAGGRIDIGKGRIEIAPGGISEADLRADLIAGRGVGTFSGTNPGIVTSAANPSPLMAPVIGYNFLPSGAAIVAWSAFGDLNLDGGVDFDDVVQFVSAGRYDTGLPANWAQGDFDYNGLVDFDDVVAFTGSRLYDKGSYLPGPGGMAAMGIGAAMAVPEPSVFALASAGVGGCVGFSMWRRRSRA